MATRAVPALLLVALIVVGALAEPPAPPPDPASFLPAADEPANLPEAGAVRTYVLGRLHGYLNGGADVIEEYGVEVAAVREWVGERGGLAVQVIRMKDDVGACAVSTYLRGRGSRRLAIGDGGYETDYQLGFFKGRWYAQFDVQEGGADVLAEARRLARAVAARLPGRGAEPPLLAVLRSPTALARSEVLLRGPLALATAEPFAGALAVEGFVIAGTARYRHGKSHARLLVADYATEEATTAALAALARALEIEGEPGAMVVARRDEEQIVAWSDGRRIRVVVK